MGLWDETPTAAQAAVGVSVCGVLQGKKPCDLLGDFARRDFRPGRASTHSLRVLTMENGIVPETEVRARFVADLLTHLAGVVADSEALLFAGVPLFWRVDLDLFARSVGRDPDYDRDNAAVRDASWSATESSLANAIAAIKAHRRGRRHDEADELLARAEERIGVGLPTFEVSSPRSSEICQ